MAELACWLSLARGSCQTGEPERRAHSRAASSSHPPSLGACFEAFCSRSNSRSAARRNPHFHRSSRLPVTHSSGNSSEFTPGEEARETGERHGYDDVHALHGRIPAVRGAGKVSICWPRVRAECVRCGAGKRRGSDAASFRGQTVSKTARPLRRRCLIRGKMETAGKESRKCPRKRRRRRKAAGMETFVSKKEKLERRFLLCAFALKQARARRDPGCALVNF